MYVIEKDEMVITIALQPDTGREFKMKLIKECEKMAASLTGMEENRNVKDR